MTQIVRKQINKLDVDDEKKRVNFCEGISADVAVTVMSVQKGVSTRALTASQDSADCSADRSSKRSVRCSLGLCVA